LPHLIIQITTQHCLPKSISFYTSGETSPFRVVEVADASPRLASMISELGEPEARSSIISMNEQHGNMTETGVKLRLEHHWACRHDGNLDPSWLSCAIEFVLTATTNARDEMSLLVA
jgi:hypothetical protein